ncbi:MAG TPA: helix-turn-helix domain-containing protein [Thermoguttaceae bacterium]|nr:helix-turn-helix domain-containing protein [Thermoguttaceae bacterium]
MDQFPSPPAALGRLELAYLYGGVVQYQAGETLGPRVLGDYELVLIVEGQVAYRVESNEHRVSPGSVILARPGFHEAYRWDPIGQTRHAYFHFDIVRHADGWPEPSSWPILRNRPAPVIGALFRHVIQLIYSHPTWPTVPPGPAECGVVETLISLFLEEQVSENALSEYGRPEAVHRTLRWMRQTLDDNPRRPVRLDDLVEVACVTDKHLCRLFRKTLGWSPMQTYNLMRLQLSLALLARTNLTMKQIADRCGYDNQFYFSRCFTKAFGRSPNRVRRDLSLGVPPPPSPLPVDMTPRVHW